MSAVMTPPIDPAHIRELAAQRRALVDRVKQLLVDRLDTGVEATMIADDESLFGRGLELDSIDTLELVVAVQEEFGVEVTDDDVEALLSVSHLADHIAAGLQRER